MTNKRPTLRYSAIFTGLWNDDYTKAEFHTIQAKGKSSRVIWLIIDEDSKEHLDQLINVQVQLHTYDNQPKAVENCTWILT